MGCLLIGWLNRWLDGIGPCCFYQFIMLAEKAPLTAAKDNSCKSTEHNQHLGHCDHTFVINLTTNRQINGNGNTCK